MCYIVLGRIWTLHSTGNGEQGHWWALRWKDFPILLWNGHSNTVPIQFFPSFISFTGIQHHVSSRFTEIFTKILFFTVLSCELMICLFLHSLVSNLSKKSQIFQAKIGDRLTMQCGNTKGHCLFYMEQPSSEMTYQVLRAIAHH